MINSEYFRKKNFPAPLRDWHIPVSIQGNDVERSPLAKKIVVFIGIICFLAAVGEMARRYAPFAMVVG